MKHSFARVHGLAALLLWTLAFGAGAAGQAKRLPDPADPGASVPPTRYEAVMDVPAASKAPSPAANWKELNRTMGSYDAMAPARDAAEPRPAAPGRDAKPATAASPAPKTEPDPHAHHRPGAAK